MLKTFAAEDIQKLGPLGRLVGSWEGTKGGDVSPNESRRRGTNSYRERTEFVPTGAVDNHEQMLYGLRYSTVAWRLGEPNAFHEELGYWLWDAERQIVMRCFTIPRGISILAGGKAQADSTSFQMSARVGDPIFGISSNPFLDEEFKTIRFDVDIQIWNDHTFSYEEDSQILMKANNTVFHHTDCNTLTRVE